MLFRSEGLYYQDALATISRERNINRYLEIGVQAGINLSKIKANEAIGIDPQFAFSTNIAANKNCLRLYQMTSDAFFSCNTVENIDFAFLDGMHRIEYLVRDFMNCEEGCKPNSLIAIHDCLPFDECMAVRDDTGGPWTGDVWKIVLILEKYRPDLKITLVDANPTGLVFVTNLDPLSKVLRNNYNLIEGEFIESANDYAALRSFYDEHKVHSTAAFLERLPTFA